MLAELADIFWKNWFFEFHRRLHSKTVWKTFEKKFSEDSLWAWQSWMTAFRWAVCRAVFDDGLWQCKFGCLSWIPFNRRNLWWPGATAHWKVRSSKPGHRFTHSTEIKHLLQLHNVWMRDPDTSATVMRTYVTRRPPAPTDSIHNYIDTYLNTPEALNRTVPGSNNRERIFNCQNSRLQSRIVPKIRISSSMHCWNGTVWAPSASNLATIRFCSTSEEGSRKELQLFMQFWSPVKVRKIVRNSMALQHDQKNAPLNGPYSQGAMRPKRFTAWQPWSLSAKRTWRVDHGTLELKQPVISSMIDPKTTLLSFMDSWCLSSASTRKYIQFGRSWAWLRKYRRVDMHKTSAESENKAFHYLICRSKFGSSFLIQT